MATIAAEWAAEVDATMKKRPVLDMVMQVPHEDDGKTKRIATVIALNGKPYVSLKAGTLTPAQAWELIDFLTDTIAERPKAPATEPAPSGRVNEAWGEPRISLPVPAPPAVDDDLPF